MRYAPLIFVILFLLLALLTAIFGPISYYGFDPQGVTLYLGAVCSAIAVGFAYGVRKPIAGPAPPTKISRNLYDRPIFDTMLSFAIVGFLFTLISAILSHDITLDFSSMGQNYNEMYRHYEKDSGHYSLTFILYSMLAAPTFIVTIWGLYYYNTFTTLKKVAILLVAFGAPAIFTLTSGTQKNIGDLVVYLGVVFLLKSIAQGRKLTSRALLIVSGIILAGIAIMGIILYQRYEFIGINVSNINQRDLAIIHFNPNHPVYHILGSDFGFTASILSEYLANGVVGLSFALHTPFTWSYMLGSSYSISVIAERLFGIPFAYWQTYPYHAANLWGWGETRWYTIFSWFASDFTFAGTIPLFAFFAYVYARCWVESLRFQNPFSILLFSCLTLGVVMMTANNQLMASPGGLATLTFTVVLYLRYRRRYNRRLVYA